MKHPQGKILLDDILHGGQNSVPPAAADVITLRSSLQYAGLDENAVREIEKRLTAIENLRED